MRNYKAVLKKVKLKIAYWHDNLKNGIRKY